MALSGLTGTLHLRTTGLRKLEQDFTLGKLTYAFDLAHSEKDRNVISEGSIVNLQSNVRVRRSRCRKFSNLSVPAMV